MSSAWFAPRLLAKAILPFDLAVLETASCRMKGAGVTTEDERDAFPVRCVTPALSSRSELELLSGDAIALIATGFEKIAMRRQNAIRRTLFLECLMIFTPSRKARVAVNHYRHSR
jgi:hypothetical protein